MRLSNILLALTAAAANAQRPADVSMCDYYTKTLLGKDNTPENQLLLVTLLVNTVILGNCKLKSRSYMLSRRERVHSMLTRPSF
jgi:hypothetical protein